VIAGVTFKKGWPRETGILKIPELDGGDTQEKHSSQGGGGKGQPLLQEGSPIKKGGTP